MLSSFFSSSLSAFPHRFYLTLFKISKKTLTDRSEFYSYKDAVARLHLIKLKILIALKIKRETDVIMSALSSRQHYSIRDLRLKFVSEIIAIDQLMQRDIMNASPAIIFAWGIWNFTRFTFDCLLTKSIRRINYD